MNKRQQQISSDFQVSGSYDRHKNGKTTHKFTTLQYRKSGLRIRIHFIRIQLSRLNTDPDPDPIWIQGFNDQKLKKKKLQLKIFFFGIKNYNLGTYP